MLAWSATISTSSLPARLKKKGRIINQIRAEWLPTILNGSFSEIYVVNCDTLCFEYINPAAIKNLQYSAEELQQMSPTCISPETQAGVFTEWLDQLRSGYAPSIAVRLVHRRKDGTHYPIESQLFYLASESGPMVIAIGNDVSQRDRANAAQLASEARLSAMVSNTPGLVYQCLLDTEGHFSFPYLSEGCEALLGVEADLLHAKPDLLPELILEEDRQSFLDTMQSSAASLSGWNWEGRLWILDWNDIKWINLRAMPRALPDGAVQWEGIMTNITSSKLEQEELIRSRARLAELTDHVTTVKEKERTRISREIHDDLGGNLTAIKMALALLTKRLPPEKDNVLREKADYVEQLVDRTIETVHRIAGDLRPGVLDFGLVAAIEWQAKEFEKQSGIPCAFIANKAEVELDLDRATALFRIFQEALTNVGKHAQASHVDVELVHTDHYVRLQIVDNGRGIQADDQENSKSFGIRNMVERSIALGGSLSVSTAPRGGTVVAINIPLPDNSD